MVPSKKIIILENIIKETIRGLLSFHPSPFKEHEGLIYWGGFEFDDVNVITTCIVPKTVSGKGEVHTTPEANAEVISLLNKNGLVLLAQVHSHPKDLKRHSPGDDKFAFMPYEGYLSVVVPHYCKRGMMPITSCGFHLYNNGHFEYLPDRWVTQNVKVVTSYTDLRGGDMNAFIFRQR